MFSLYQRVVFGGILWAVLATLFGAFAVINVFDRIANRSFNNVLLEQQSLAIVALGNSETPDAVDAWLTLPDYQRTYSGRYWQIENSDGALLTSRSLFDFELDIAPDTTGFWEAAGPQDRVRGVTEHVVTEDGVEWSVSVAASLNDLAVERAEVQRNVTLTFGFVALIGVACAGLLTTLLLSPIRKLGRDVLHRWDAGSELVPTDYPREVAPLVADINELIRRNHSIHDRGRRQAADLAHALKTPSAALRNELVALSRRVSDVGPLFEALDRIDAQVTRSLARMRAASASDAVRLSSNVAHSVSRIERLFRSMAEADGKTFSVTTADVNVLIDQHDLEEMLGNLLDNAFKWSASTVILSVSQTEESVSIVIEDDGPGVPKSWRERALQPGGRLDTSVPGTGIGLAIVDDLTDAYGGKLTLDRSSKGGLLCRIDLPKATSAAPIQVSHSA